MTTYNLVSEETLQSKVERHESLENRLSVSFKNMSFREKKLGCLTIFYELHSIGSSKLPQDITVKIVVYNKKDEIMAVKEHIFRESSFYEFDIVETNIYAVESKNIPQIGKIKIFPTPCQ